MKLIIFVSVALFVLLTLVEDSNGHGRRYWRRPPAKPTCTSTRELDVGFLVWSRDTFTTKAGQNLVFDFAERNDGGGYDAKTGIFHAPVAGLYHFFWNILSYNNTKGCTILFKHNGNIKMRSFIMPSRLHQTPSGSIYLRMNKDDKVYLESGDSGAFIDDDGYSTFGGELIRC